MHTEKILVTSEKFHGVPRESIAQPFFNYIDANVLLQNITKVRKTFGKEELR